MTFYKGNFHFEISFEGVFVTSPRGTKHIVTKATIMANGLCDLCITRDIMIEGRSKYIAKLSDTPIEDIFYVPKGDLLIIEISPPLDRNVTFIADIGADPVLTDVVKGLAKFDMIEKKGKDWDMYAGGDYGI
jgi:hypothetical protein